MPNNNKHHGNLCSHQHTSPLTWEGGIGFNLRQKRSKGERRWEKCLLKGSFVAPPTWHGGAWADVNAVLADLHQLRGWHSILPSTVPLTWGRKGSCWEIFLPVPHCLTGGEERGTSAEPQLTHVAAQRAPPAPWHPAMGGCCPALTPPCQGKGSEGLLQGYQHREPRLAKGCQTGTLLTVFVPAVTHSCELLLPSLRPSWHSSLSGGCRSRPRHPALQLWGFTTPGR